MIELFATERGGLANLRPNRSRGFSILIAMISGTLLGCEPVSPPASSSPEKKVTSEVSADVREVVIEGKIVHLMDGVRDKTKLELDAEPWKGIVAIQTKDGELVQILPTSAGRFFHSDPALIGRSIRVQGRMHPGVPGVEIIERHTLVDGRPHEVYYWCEICSIKMHYLQQCECCQGPVELREHPVGEPFIPRSKSTAE